MLHRMKLSESPFNNIKSGEKIIEVRLNDKKRQLVKVGDDIEFSKLPAFEENILVKVVKLDKFEDFNSLLEKYPDKLGLSRFKSKDEWVNKIREIYSQEEEEKYGVLAIHIQLIN